MNITNLVMLIVLGINLSLVYFLIRKLIKIKQKERAYNMAKDKEACMLFDVFEREDYDKNRERNIIRI